MPLRSKSTPRPHQPFAPECRCIKCRNPATTEVRLPVPESQPGAAASDGAPLDAEAPKWHRAGWQGRRYRYNGPEPQVEPQVDTGPTLDRVPRVYNGPVYLRPVESTFMHSRMMQHTHKTVLLRSSLPSRDTNYGALLSDMDVRLHNMHQTLAAVHARSASVVTQQLAGTAADSGAALQQHGFGGQGYSGGAADAEAEGQAGAAEYVDSISLRRAVNGSLDRQLDFFTTCMAKWCLDKSQCRCIPCDCICQRSHAILASRVHGWDTAEKRH